MFHRVLRVAVVTSLALLPIQQIAVGHDSHVALAQGGACRSPAYAAAFLYSGGFITDAAGTLTGTYGDYSTCLQGAQISAIFVAAQACGSYGSGQAYAQVTWEVYWNEDYQGQVNQQYDCGDI